MIFGTLNPEKIWHANLTDLSTSPVRFSHFTLGNPKKIISAVLFMHVACRGFYRAMLCIRGTSHGPVSVSLSVCVCVCHKPVFY